MEGDNLVNRYDQLVFAGAALGVIQQDHEAWYDVFFSISTLRYSFMIFAMSTSWNLGTVEPMRSS